MAFDIDLIRKVYDRYPSRIAKAKEILQRPMTMAEKVLYSHLFDGEPTKEYKRGEDYVNFAPDRIAMQDATAQMAVLQFMLAGQKIKVCRTPQTIHRPTTLLQQKKGV